MSSLSRLTGSPWHPEKMIRSEGDDRRHRSRCVFYDKKTKHCSKTYAGCYGAAHCSYYQEFTEDRTETPTKDKPVHITNSSLSKNYTEEQKKVAKWLSVPGTRCKHRSFGVGTVVSADDKYVIVHFESGKEKKMLVEFIVEKNLISLL